MRVEFRITGDGSHTLFVPELNEHYHSTFGAIAESEHIFIKNGLQALPPEVNPIKILETGFGTGLNASLTAVEAEKTGKDIIFHSIEAFPVPENVWSRLNYPEEIQSHGNGDHHTLFTEIHQAGWDQIVQVAPHFTLLKIHQLLENFTPDENQYHVIYFDAFGPDVQPEMWTEEIFRTLHRSMIQGGILVTYSVKGMVKRALKKAGFKINKVPGPPGKREILVARR